MTCFVRVSVLGGCLFILLASGCVYQIEGQKTEEELAPVQGSLVYVVEGTAPPTVDVGECVPGLVSVSSDWAMGVLRRSSLSQGLELSAYGRKMSFRRDMVGRDVVDVEFFRVDRYPDWRTPRPWIMGGFPYYFRVTISVQDMSVLKGNASPM